jgi:hypothetical protein
MIGETRMLYSHMQVIVTGFGYVRNLDKYNNGLLFAS